MESVDHTEQIIDGSGDGGSGIGANDPSSRVPSRSNVQFSEEEKNLLVHKHLIIQDFPSCSEDISAHFSCLRRVKFLLPSLQRFPEPLDPKEICGKTEAKMTFCILSTFCPGEAKRLTACMGGKIPNLAGKTLMPPSPLLPLIVIQSALR